jgi:hypothetical protein
MTSKEQTITEMPQLLQLVLNRAAKADVAALKEKHKTYGDSWKRRGGVGAFMMLARKWDRIENQCRQNGYDIFELGKEQFAAVDGILDDIQDLRRYLLLVESEVCLRCKTLDEITAMRHISRVGPEGIAKEIAEELSEASGEATSAYVSQDPTATSTTKRRSLF